MKRYAYAEDNQGPWQLLALALVKGITEMSNPFLDDTYEHLMLITPKIFYGSDEHRPHLKTNGQGSTHSLKSLWSMAVHALLTNLLKTFFFQQEYIFLLYTSLQDHSTQDQDQTQASFFRLYTDMQLNGKSGYECLLRHDSTLPFYQIEVKLHLEKKSCLLNMLIQKIQNDLIQYLSWQDTRLCCYCALAAHHYIATFWRRCQWWLFASHHETFGGLQKLMLPGAPHPSLAVLVWY